MFKHLCALALIAILGRVALADGMSDDDKAAYKKLRNEREKMVHDRGDVFAKIAIKHDYTGEYVVYRDADVTAFLDLKDPQHPRYDAANKDKDNGKSQILVVPNQARESIGKTVASDITTEDLELTLKVMKAATTLAPKLGFKNPRVYVKSPERVGVGYLHVHIEGDRDPKAAYPAALK